MMTSQSDQREKDLGPAMVLAVVMIMSLLGGNVEK